MNVSNLRLHVYEIYTPAVLGKEKPIWLNSSIRITSHGFINIKISVWRAIGDNLSYGRAIHARGTYTRTLWWSRGWDNPLACSHNLLRLAHCLEFLDIFTLPKSTISWICFWAVPVLKSCVCTTCTDACRHKCMHAHSDTHRDTVACMCKTLSPNSYQNATSACHLHVQRAWNTRAWGAAYHLKAWE